MRFIKMHGLGNDYVFVDCLRGETVEDPAERARQVSRPHFGIGADGLVLMEPSARADARMRIFNKDGSEAEMCGNAIRCVGKYLYDTGLCRREEIRVETGAGVLSMRLRLEGDVAVGASVDMGAPVLEPDGIPVLAPDNRVEIEAEGRKLRFFCLSLGNPHAVTWDVFPDDNALARLGALVENHPLFPRRINAEFCRVESPECARVLVWERGSGATLACGTGASAAFAALTEQGFLRPRAEIVLPGGSLEFERRADGHVIMTGPATVSFAGEWTDSVPALCAEARDKGRA